MNLLAFSAGDDVFFCSLNTCSVSVSVAADLSTKTRSSAHASVRPFKWRTFTSLLIAGSNASKKRAPASEILKGKRRMPKNTRASAMTVATRQLSAC